MDADLFIPCTLRELPEGQVVQAAACAVAVNPANRACVEAFAGLFPGLDFQPEHLAVLVSKYWGAGGVKLSVSFLDSPPASVRTRILAHANAWSAYANVRFMETSGQGQIRIARTRGQGYYSYLGTDILSIPAGQPTMNLEAFSDATPESEYVRVVRHEFGHSQGFPHEHMRRELVARIDRAKAIAYFARTQGWSAQVVQQQVLTPLDESSLLGTAHADQTSIMCYQLPGSITVDGQPIIGGTDIDAQDQGFAARVYPLAVPPPPPPPPPPVGVPATAQILDAAGNVLYRFARQ